MNSDGKDLSYPTEGWTNADDVAIVDRMVDTDETALGALYDQWNRELYSLVLNLLEDSDQAEDVVEETFWQAWGQASSYEPLNGEVSDWLATICRKKAVDRLRVRGRDPEPGLAAMEQATATLDDLISVVQMNRGRSAGIRSRIVVRARAERESKSVAVAGRPDLARGVASLTGLGHRATPGAQGAVTGETRKVTPSYPNAPQVTQEVKPARILIAYAAIATLAAVASAVQLTRVSGERRELRDRLAAVDTLTPVADSLENALVQKKAMITKMTGRDVQVVPLLSPSAESMGRVIWNRASNDWVVIAHGLREPREGMIYQVWLVTDYARIPAGTFKPDSAGKTMMSAKQAVGRNALRSIAITEEPEGGVPSPTGPTIAAGSA